MAGPAALLLAPLVLAGFEDRVEARARAFTDGPARIDLVESARFELRMNGERNQLSLSYAPTLLVLSVTTPEETALGLGQTLDATVTHTYRRGFVSLQQAATLTRNNLRLTLGAQAAAPSGGSMAAPVTPPVPSGDANVGPLFDQLVWFGSTRTTLGFGQNLARRWNAYEYASYGVQGGLDSDDLAFYPRQLEVGGGAGIQQNVSRADDLTHGVNGRHFRNSRGPEVLLIDARESWRHRFTERSFATLSAGVAYASERDEAGRDDTWRPIAEAGLETRWSARGYITALEVAAGVVPTVDLFTGRLDQRAFGRAALAQDRHAYRWYVAANGISSLEVDQEDSLSSVAGSAGIGRPLTPELTLEASILVSWQLRAQEETPPALWMTSVGLTYRPRPLRL